MGSLTKKRLAIIVIIGFSVFLRAHWLFDNDAAWRGDEIFYDSLARRMLAGQGYTLETGEPTAWRTPGLPVLLSLIYLVIGDDPNRARAILALLTGLTSLGVFWLCF